MSQERFKRNRSIFLTDSKEAIGIGYPNFGTVETMINEHGWRWERLNKDSPDAFILRFRLASSSARSSSTPACYFYLSLSFSP